MKVRKIDIEKNRIELTHKEQNCLGIYSAFCGKLNRVLKEGEMIYRRYAVWNQTNLIHLELAFSYTYNGPGSFWRLEAKGRKILAKAGIKVGQKRRQE